MNLENDQGNMILDIKNASFLNVYLLCVFVVKYNIYNISAWINTYLKENSFYFLSTV